MSHNEKIQPIIQLICKKNTINQNELPQLVNCIKNTINLNPVESIEYLAILAYNDFTKIIKAKNQISNYDERARQLMIKEHNTINNNAKEISYVNVTNNPKLSYKAYVFLDSFRRLRGSGSNDNITYIWNISTGNRDQFSSVGSYNHVQNVKSVKLLPFLFPRTTRIANNLKRLGICISEFQTAAYQLCWNVNVNIVMKLDNQASDTSKVFQLEATPLDTDNSTIYFRKPLQYLSTLSLTFTDPNHPIVMPDDQVVCNITQSSTNPTNALLTIASGVHNSNVGDIIYILGYSPTTSTPNTIALTNAINRINGWIISVVPDAVTFEIEVNSLLVDNKTVQVLLGSRRVEIPIEIECEEI